MSRKRTRTNLPLFQKSIHEAGKEIELEVGRRIKVAGKAIVEYVIPATPIKTGYARLNWRVSFGEPIYTERPLVSEDPEKNFQFSMEDNLKQVRRYTTYKKGNLYIRNNAQYINKLNQGSSKQAGANFIQFAVDKAIDSIGKK